MTYSPARSVVTVLVASWCALAPARVAAQRERLTVRAEAFGATDIATPAGPGDRAFRQQGAQATLAHRVLRDQGSTVLLLGAHWRGVRATLPRVAGAADDTPTDLHVATAELMLLRTVGDRHTVVGVARPGLYGDALRVEGALFVDRIVSPRTTLGVGMSYASSFGKLLPIPVVHVVARPRRRVLVDALLPARGDVWWMPRKGLDVGVNLSLAGANYALTPAQRVANADALWLANATAGPQVKWTPRGGKWQLSADAGMTVLRRLEYARGGRSVADLAPGNVPYARLGVQRLF